MLKYFSSLGGKQTTGEGPAYPKPKGTDFVWVYARAPSEEEVKRLSKDFSVPQELFAQFAREERSHAYSTAPLVFTIADYYVEGDEIRSTNLLFALTKNALITVIPERLKYYAELFERVCKDFSNTLKTHKAHSHQGLMALLLHAFWNADVEDNYEILQKTEDAIIELEAGAASFGTSVKVREITEFKRFLSLMGKRFWASARMVSIIRSGLTPLVLDAELTQLFESVYESYLHQIDLLSSQKEMLSDSLTVYETTISNRLASTSNELNQIMKKLTALTIIIMVPTLIAGIYGMNFLNMPELKHELGYAGALALMLVAGLFVYYMFHKRDWI
ncbi:hypothetical protein H0N96_00820 [Candidatus Micrarchaeota archaeon]|nr:hypothetical protein [Candidatus Micrarchaeota archaeon]